MSVCNVQSITPTPSCSLYSKIRKNITTVHRYGNSKTEYGLKRRKQRFGLDLPLAKVVHIHEMNANERGEFSVVTVGYNKADLTQTGQRFLSVPTEEIN